MTSPSKKTFLVTGAAGQTGSYTVPLLVREVIAYGPWSTTTTNARRALRREGAEVVTGDLLDLASVRAVLRGVDSAYFCYPIAPGLVEATAYFAQAARDEGLTSIVNMSQVSSREDAGSDAARHHWIAERVFDWASIP